MPEIYQCQWNGTPRAFFCVNSRTGARLKFQSNAPSMKAAQCVSPDDYKKLSDWADTVKSIAEQRCR